MSTKMTNIILILMIALAFGVVCFAYPLLPDQIASHWNASGEVDGYMDKFWGLMLLPLIMVFFYVLYLTIPKMDPLKNIASFQTTYNALWVVLSGFFLCLFAVTLFWNFGYEFNFTYAMSPAIGLLFYFLGTVLEKSKRNWFVGIRTPWTLTSDEVWDKTHRLGGKLFKVAGLVSLLGVFFGSEASIVLMLVSVSVAAISSVVYSYFVYTKMVKSK